MSARRLLYGNTPKSKAGQHTATSEFVHESDSFATLSSLVVKLNDNIAGLSDSLNQRIDRLEDTLEAKSVHKIASIFDKRINVEMNKVKKDFESKIQYLKDEIATDMEIIEEKVSELKDRVNEGETYCNKQSLNIVIRGLQYHDGENVNTKVNNLFKDGVCLPNIRVVNAIRKSTDSRSKPGLIIATFQTEDDKNKVLKHKKMLKNSNQYKRVFIDRDLPANERTQNNNLRTLVRCLRDQGYDIKLHGNKIFDNASENNRHNYTKQSDSSRQDEYSKQESGHSRKNSIGQDYDRNSRNTNNRDRSDYSGNNHTNFNNQYKRNDRLGSFSGRQDSDYARSNLNKNRREQRNNRH
jgi:hypothetical protein